MAAAETSKARAEGRVSNVIPTKSQGVIETLGHTDLPTRWDNSTCTLSLCRLSEQYELFAKDMHLTLDGGYGKPPDCIVPVCPNQM
jgi:hypothetical protein